jgi:hypothetical protein
MGAAGDLGMDEGRTGKVRRVSVNSAGSFVLFSCIFYGLEHCLFVFILFDCFFRNLGFSFIQLSSSNVLSFSCIYSTTIELPTALSSPVILQ